MLLELVQVLGALPRHDHRGQAAGDPHPAARARHHRQRRGDRQLQQLEPLVPALVVTALAVISAELVLQPLQVGSSTAGAGTASIGRTEPGPSSRRAIGVPWVGGRFLSSA